MSYDITISDEDSHDALYSWLVLSNTSAAFSVDRDAHGAFASSTWSFNDTKTATMCKLKFG